VKDPPKKRRPIPIEKRKKTPITILDIRTLLLLSCAVHARKYAGQNPKKMRGTVQHDKALSPRTIPAKPLRANRCHKQRDFAVNKTSAAADNRRDGTSSRSLKPRYTVKGFIAMSPDTIPVRLPFKPIFHRLILTSPTAVTSMIAYSVFITA
jgi:hypothetical protein